MSKLSIAAEAAASRVVLGSLLGVEPDMVQLPNGQIMLEYRGTNIVVAREKLNALFTAMRTNKETKPSGVKYSMGNVVVPVMLRQLWWIGPLGALVGYGVYAYGKKQGKRQKSLGLMGAL